MASYASGIVSEGLGKIQAALGLPIDFGNIFEHLAINVLSSQASFFGVKLDTPGRKVALDAMGDHPAFIREMSRLDPALSCLGMDMAALVTEPVSRGFLHASMPGKEQEHPTNQTRNERG